MESKHYLLSIIFISLILCTAFTSGSLPSHLNTKLSKKASKKLKKKDHRLIIFPSSSSSTFSYSTSTYSLNCFQNPLEAIPTFYLSDTTNKQKENTSEPKEIQETQQDDILSLLDEEALQKSDSNNLTLDIFHLTMDEAINVSPSSNLAVTPQLLEKLSERQGFVTSLVDIATAQEGVPYVYGGKSPKGFDCSGFVYYVYGQLGIDLPVSSSSYEYVGESVDLKDVQVGDILCFTGRNAHSGRTGHVGIVVENNPNEPIKFIHAASGSRRKITYSTMESSYYKPRFRSARRIPTPVLEDIFEKIEETE